MPDLPWMCSVCTKSKQTKEKKAKLNWKHTNRRTGRSNSRQLLLAANWTRTNGGDVNDPKLHQATGMSNSAERVISYKTSLELSKSFVWKLERHWQKKASIWILVLWILVGIYKWNRYLIDCVEWGLLTILLQTFYTLARLISFDELERTVVLHQREKLDEWLQLTKGKWSIFYILKTLGIDVFGGIYRWVPIR